MFAFVKKLMPKKNNATVSMIHTAHRTGKSNKQNDATIPIPQTRKIIFRIFFFLVTDSVPFVKRKIELYANNPKNITANIMCNMLLIWLSIMNVPIFSCADVMAQGNKQMPSPDMPEQVSKTSSMRSYPLYEIKRNEADPKIIMNTVHALVYHVADMELGK